MHPLVAVARSLKYPVLFILWNFLVPTLVISQLLGSDLVREACGNEDGMEEAFRNISARATALHNNITCRVATDSSEGAMGLVKQVSFDDGLKWAVKVVKKEIYPLVTCSKAIWGNGDLGIWQVELLFHGMEGGTGFGI
jgi:hypothetical protein